MQQTIAEGSNVCMVSAAYAQYNDYQLGDKLTLDLYDTGFYAGDAIPRGPCLPEDRMNVTGEYEIVGIYSAPGVFPWRTVDLCRYDSCAKKIRPRK